MFVERRWFEKAGVLVLKKREYVLQDDVYEGVLEYLREGKLKRLILERWEMDKNV